MCWCCEFDILFTWNDSNIKRCITEGQECFATLITPSSLEDLTEVFISLSFLRIHYHHKKSFLPKIQIPNTLTTIFFIGWTITICDRRRISFLIDRPCHYIRLSILSSTQLQSQQTTPGRQLCDCGISPSPSTKNTMPTCDTFCGGSMNCNNNAVCDNEDGHDDVYVVKGYQTLL